MTTKHIQLRIDFTLTVADTPPCLLPGDIEPPELAHEYDARQARLLSAVRSQPEVLEAWLHQVIVWHMYSHAWHDWDTLLMGKEFSCQELLAPAIASLPREDQDFFSEGHHLGYFEDYIDLFQQSFSIQEAPPCLVELPPVEQRANRGLADLSDEDCDFDALFAHYHIRQRLIELSHEARTEFLAAFPPPCDEPQEESELES